MTTKERAGRRARRIAADEAHAWARNLRLGNHHAKSVLRSLTLYVDGDGFCFVGIEQLADDCELSADTVRRRLVWLEEIGSISRQSQWIDASGVRNGEGRGKRTSDLIRLLVEADQDEIEARARGEVIVENDAETTAISPSWQPGLNQPSETVSPTPALRQPSHCGEGLISEPEPESPPRAPSGGESETPAADQAEPEHFGPAWLAWPGHEVMRRDLALAEFRQLTPAQQRLCRAAIPLFVQMQVRLGRKHPPNFHLWIRNRGFDEFPTATLEETAPGTANSVEATSVEARALRALYALARVSLFEHRGRVVYPLPITAQVLAFAEVGSRSGWHWIEDSRQLAAWSTFLSAHVHVARPDLTITRGERRGFYAPWPWPPRKDGTISETEGESAA